MIAFNYIPRPDLDNLVVKRKGKVIKGETQILRDSALKEFRSMRNASKRIRRERRAGYTVFELLIVLGTLTCWAFVIVVIIHFLTKFW